MKVDFARAVFGNEERAAVNRVMEGYWLASGKENEAFEEEFAAYVGAKYAVCCNSGSSANLLALASLNLPRGSTVITSACGFPATLSPILHLLMRPLLIDYSLYTHNANLNQLSYYLDSDPEDFNIKAVIIAHTLGNPVQMNEFLHLAKSRNIYVIEDCCEAVGTKIKDHHVGTFGDLGTFSFYPAHQMTALGGGGMVVTDNQTMALSMKSMRDWGKAWDWDQKLGDQKTNFTTNLDGIEYYKGYTYDTLGWNFKLPEANAAFGREQLKKLDGFADQRAENFRYLKKKLRCVEELIFPESMPYARISWFGYPLTLQHQMLDRNELVNYLEAHGIRTRPFFAGNITRHIPFKAHAGDFPVADQLMRDSCFVGCWAGITKKQLDFIASTVKEWIRFQLRS